MNLQHYLQFEIFHLDHYLHYFDILYTERFLENQYKLILHSDNKLYDPIEVSVEDIMEVWEAVGFISFDLPDPEGATSNIDQLAQAVLQLQSDMAHIKQKIN